MAQSVLDGDNHINLPFSYGVSGHISVSVPVEEWVDYVAPTIDPNETEHFPSPVPARLNIYEMIPAGATITASVTSGGATATSAIVVSTATAVSYVCQGQVTAFIAVGGSTASMSQNVSIAFDINGQPAAGTSTYTYTGSGGTVATDNSTGAHVGISSYSPAFGYGSITGSVSNTVYPKKAFSLTGQINSVDISCPDTVTVNLARFAGDPSPTISASGGFSAAHEQRQSAFSASVNSGAGYFDNDSSSGGSAVASHSESLNEFAPIAPTVGGAWCLANDQYVAYQVTDDAGNIANRLIYNSEIWLHGWQFPGVTITQAGTFTVDAGTTTTNWMGAALTGAGLGNAGSGAIVRTWSPFFNMSGYRYLTIAAAGTTAATDQTRTLTIGGKTWHVLFRAGSAADAVIDLCDPFTGGADNDTTDSWWPDNNPTLGGGWSGVSDGPLWGCGYVTSLSLSGFTGASTESFSNLHMTSHGATYAHFLGQWAPRYSHDMVQAGPEWDNGSGTVFTRKYARDLICTTDGRQSMEVSGHSVLKTEGGGSGVTFYTPKSYPISSLPSLMETCQRLDGNDTATPYIGYQTPGSGWDATVSAPTPDGTSNMRPNFLGSTAPIPWLWGNGILYDPTTGFTSGVGLSIGGSLSVPAQVIFTSIDWYPGCTDPFGFSASPTTGTVYLAASKIFRGQSHGLLLTNTHLAASGSAVDLYPGAGEIQPSGTSVGHDTSNTNGLYRTSGAGLDGIIITTSPSPPNMGGGANPDTINANPASGSVQSRYMTGSPRATATAFWEKKLSRVAMRLPVAVMARIRRLTNLAEKRGPFHLAAPLYNGDGSAAGIGYWRCDTGAPGAWDSAAVIITSGAFDDNPSLAMDHRARLYCAFDRTSSGGTAGGYEAYSDDDGQSWSTPAMSIPNGMYSIIRTGQDKSLYRIAYIDDGSGASTGTLQGSWQAPGDAAPSALFTLKKSTGAAITLQQGAFGIDHMAETASRWILSILEIGATSTSNWVSADDAGGTFVRLP